MSDYIQEQNVPPEIDPKGGERALSQIINLAKSTYKKLYELEERIKEMEKFFKNEGRSI